MFVYNESESRKNLQVEWMQGVDFFRNVVVRGEEIASREYLEKYRFGNKFPWVFCALHRWCRNDKLVSPAYFERECVAWYDGEKDVYKRQHLYTIFLFIKTIYIFIISLFRTSPIFKFYFLSLIHI